MSARPVLMLAACLGFGCTRGSQQSESSTPAEPATVQTEPVPAAEPPQKRLPQAPHPRCADPIEELIRTLDDNYDQLHGDYSPSVHKLIKFGEPALPRMLDLMLSEDEITRLHAQRVLEGVMLTRYGFVVGKGWQNPTGEERFLAFWKSHGNLSWDARLKERERAVTLWRAWLAERKK